MQKLLYILAEGEADEVFYEALCERVTGATFLSQQDLRLRHGQNWKTAMGLASLLMRRIRYWKGTQDIIAVIAVDNDRHPGHPGGNSFPNQPGRSARNKTSRYQAMQEIVHGKSGDAAPSSVRVAIAVPVEMIESWVLLLLDPARPELPYFAEAAQPSAIRYYAKAKVPPQLKDLVNVETTARRMQAWELFFEAAKKGDLEGAMFRSHSLAMFVEEIRQFA